MAKRNFELERKIISLVAEGLYPSKIANALHISTTLAIRHLARLEHEGYVQAAGKCPKFFELTGKDFKQLKVASSPPVRTTAPHVENRRLISDFISLHDFKVKIPITTFGQRLKNEKTISINNWIKRYCKDDLPINATLEITTKSAIIHFHETQIPRSLGFNAAVAEFAIAGCSAIAAYLGLQGYKLDFKHPKVISQHFAAKTAEEIDRKVANGVVFRIKLGRKARAFTGPMAQDAAAWVDRSKGPLEIESNDVVYEQLLLEMPVRMARVEIGFSEYDKRLNLYDENIKKHLAVLDDMRKTMRGIRKEIKGLKP